jgi:hypothetical protein
MPTAFDGGQAAACLELPCRGRKAVTAISTWSSSTPSSVLRSGKQHVGPDRLTTNAVERRHQGREGADGRCAIVVSDLNPLIDAVRASAAPSGTHGDGPAV